MIRSKMMHQAKKKFNKNRNYQKVGKKPHANIVLGAS